MESLAQYILWNFKLSMKKFCTDGSGRPSQQKFTTALDTIMGAKRKDAEDARVREAVAKAKAEARGGLLNRVLG